MILSATCSITFATETLMERATSFRLAKSCIDLNLPLERLVTYNLTKAAALQQSEHEDEPALTAVNKYQTSHSPKLES